MVNISVRNEFFLIKCSLINFNSTSPNTAVDSSEQSVSGVDFLVNEGSIDMLQDVNRVAVDITILQVILLSIHLILETYL